MSDTVGQVDDYHGRNQIYGVMGDVRTSEHGFSFLFKICVCVCVCWG